MSRARLLLHLAALLVPLAAAAGWAWLLARDDPALMLRQTLIFGTGGAFAAEIAVLLRWRTLDSRAREGRGAWLTGVGMAAITHALFGIFFAGALVAATGWTASMGTGHVSDLFVQAIFFIAASVFGVGLITFPATAVIAEVVASLRRKELARGDR